MNTSHKRSINQLHLSQDRGESDRSISQLSRGKAGAGCLEEEKGPSQDSGGAVIRSWSQRYRTRPGALPSPSGACEVKGKIF